MSIVLFRVDERLIHGQVIVGWGAELHPDRIVVVDDEIANSQWEQELYAMGLPSEVTPVFEEVASARTHLGDWRAGGERVLILTRDVATMHKLAEGGAMRGDEVNIGGIHYAPGRQAILPYVYLSGDEIDHLNALAGEGVRVTARDLPAARRVDLKELLQDRKN
jgi:PTS system mannose-specific IIB component/fructoselysine and glucoselysine-specific PTS system IIB component